MKETYKTADRELIEMFLSISVNQKRFHLYCVFTYIHLFLIDKNFHECQNLSINSLCAILHVSFIQRSHFLVRSNDQKHYKSQTLFDTIKHSNHNNISAIPTTMNWNIAASSTGTIKH
jgi:hypothetical protein